MYAKEVDLLDTRVHKKTLAKKHAWNVHQMKETNNSNPQATSNRAKKALMRGLVGVFRLGGCLVFSPKHNYVWISWCEGASVIDEAMKLCYMKWKTLQIMAMEEAMFESIQWCGDRMQ